MQVVIMLVGSLVTLSLLGFLTWYALNQQTLKRHREEETLRERADRLERELEDARQEIDLQRELADRRRAERMDAQAQLEKLQESLAALKTRETGAYAEAQTDAQLLLFEKLANVLVQMPTVAHAVAEGAEVSVEDALALMHPIDRAMAEMGFTPIGAPGEETAFDPRLHQGAPSLEVGQPVRVKFVGYRHGEHILRRAQVAR